MDYYVYTDVGSREINEDYADCCHLTGEQSYFVVCDGLGGHGKGEVASELVAKTVLEYAKENHANREELLEQSVLYAQQTLLQAQRDLNAHDEMKTTVVALHICGNEAQWAHVGDSRLYVFRKKKVLQRTLDHSVPQMLVAAGEIKEKQIRNHPDRNRLIRVMGIAWNGPKYEISAPLELQSGDAMLLCTDGFWELIDEKEMIKCLKKAKSAQQWLETMGELVKKNGKGSNMDNNTAIGVIW